MHKLVVPLMALALAGPARAETPPPHVNIATVAPRPEDVASVDGIVKALYEVVSGPVGQQRQWERGATLFAPGARLVRTTKDKNNQVQAGVMDWQSFVDRAQPFVMKNGFYERELRRQTESYGNVTHVLSSYASRHSADGPVYDRGVNSIQLYNDGKRWWIISIAWDRERPDNPIPKSLLP